MSKIRYELKGKNGQVYVYDNGEILIGRAGWFGVLYQFFSKGCLQFGDQEWKTITIRKPDYMRGYIRFEGDKGKAVIWLTRPNMLEQAEKIRDYLEKRRQTRQLKQGEHLV